MIRLDEALRAWGTPGFEATLKREVERLDTDQLPLQQGLSTGNHVADGPITVTINSVADTEGVIRVKAGIFYRSVIGGCSCADDPTTASEINEYCDVQLDIDKADARVTIRLVTGPAD